MGAPGGDHEVGASPLAALEVAATKVQVLRGISQGALLGAVLGHPAALHGLCRGVPICSIHRGPTLARPALCRRTISIIKILWSAVINVTWFQTVVT